MVQTGLRFGYSGETCHWHLVTRYNKTWRLKKERRAPLRKQPNTAAGRQGLGVGGWGRWRKASHYSGDLLTEKTQTSDSLPSSKVQSVADAEGINVDVNSNLV